jgi:hypothetical protein
MRLPVEITRRKKPPFEKGGKGDLKSLTISLSQRERL